MKETVLLNYLFMFEPSKTWQHRHQFEADLFKFFEEKGFSSGVMPYIEGGGGPRIVCIDKLPEIEIPVEQPKPGAVQKNLEKLRKEYKEPKKKK